MENLYKFKSIIFIWLIILVCLLMVACSNKSSDGTAALVNGVKISEDDVTNKVMEYRTQHNLLDDETWKKHMKANNTNSKKVRDTYLDKLIELEVYKQIAKENNITASSDDALVSYVKAKFVRDATPPKDAYSKLLVTYGDKLNGSKGYYQLMFKNSEEQHAMDVYQQINSGSLRFQDAIKQRLTEDTDGVNFDYVIYDCMIVNPDPCPSVLAGLHTGQISEPIHTKDYIYIFDVVDEVSCDVPLTSLSSLSDFTQDNLRYYSKILDAQNIVDDAYKKAKKEFDIKKFDMPEGLPY